MTYCSISIFKHVPNYDLVKVNSYSFILWSCDRMFLANGRERKKEGREREGGRVPFWLTVCWLHSHVQTTHTHTHKRESHATWDNAHTRNCQPASNSYDIYKRLHLYAQSQNPWEFPIRLIIYKILTHDFSRFTQFLRVHFSGWYCILVFLAKVSLNKSWSKKFFYLVRLHSIHTTVRIHLAKKILIKHTLKAA